MSLHAQQTEPTKHSKSYKTYERVSKAGRDVIELIKSRMDKSFEAGRTPDQFIVTRTEEGRWSPVIITRNTMDVYYVYDYWFG